MNKFILLKLFFMLCFFGACNTSNNKVEKMGYDEQYFEIQRRQMVEHQIKSRGIKDKKVIEAMLKVPRHHYMPDNIRSQAYEDCPQPIGSGQTISQPYIVALMTEALNLKGDEKVLEIGTGSGYQAAILAEIAKEVYSIEIIDELGTQALKTLKTEGYKNVYLKIDDGYKGWEENAPYDRIIVTAAPEQIPKPLIEQLKISGILVIPVGSFFQDLIVVEKTDKGIKKTSIAPVRFVPMTGEAQKE